MSTKRALPIAGRIALSLKDRDTFREVETQPAWPGNRPGPAQGRSALVRMLAAALFFASLAAPALAHAPLTFEERLAAQEAIERVFYEHRIWPKANPNPKPPFETMLPRKVIEKKVRRYLAESQALDTFWHRPLTPRQLQAEMDRMAKRTKDPDMLRELFHALDDAPT